MAGSVPPQGAPVQRSPEHCGWGRLLAAPRSIYPNFELRDTNKGWVREWFVVSNPAPCLSARTGRAPEYKACWEELLTTEEMAHVERLLKVIADLSVRGLTGTAVALSFCKRLTQPIQERVHPAFEYWGRQDPTRGQERKGPQEEIANRVARIMAGQIWDKGCPKAHCLKRPTDAVSFLESSELFPLFLLCFFDCTHWVVIQLGVFAGQGLGVRVPRSSA